MTDRADRRPLATRQRAWAHSLAHFFVRIGVSPNQMSVASIGCAVLCALAYWGSGVATMSVARAACLVAAAAFIQLRLLANMLDGLMAIEGGRKSATGIIYNELPDRVADAIILVAAGYVTAWPWLGWLAAVLAVITAYVRAFGGSLGYAQDFSGPMAKPHRMFALTVGTVAAAILPRLPIVAVTLAIIALGAAVTVIRRTLHLARNLTECPRD